MNSGIGWFESTSSNVDRSVDVPVRHTLLAFRLTAKANNRKEKLLDSYDYQRFLSDYRDLMQWISAMNQLVSSQELANDVTGRSAAAAMWRHCSCN